jgi:DNA-binding NtrC family response regulator
MAVNVVLAVGLDRWQFAAHDSAWRSSGYVVLSVNSIRDAIEHFKTGDFDLVLLGGDISSENKERLTYLIRASSPRTPVISIERNSGEKDLFVDATLRDDSSALLIGMGELLAQGPITRQVRSTP